MNGAEVMPEYWRALTRRPERPRPNWTHIAVMICMALCAATLAWCAGILFGVGEPRLGVAAGGLSLAVMFVAVQLEW